MFGFMSEEVLKVVLIPFDSFVEINRGFRKKNIHQIGTSGLSFKSSGRKKNGMAGLMLVVVG